VEWSQVSGRGTIHSYTVVRRAPGPAFAADVPYAVVLVDLAEGPRMLSNLVDADVEAIRIGDPVEVVFDAVTDDITLPRFRPAPAAADSAAAVPLHPYLQKALQAAAAVPPLPRDPILLRAAYEKRHGGAAAPACARRRRPDHRRSCRRHSPARLPPRCRRRRARDHLLPRRRLRALQHRNP
jgi:hypothetical protein